MQVPTAEVELLKDTYEKVHYMGYLLNTAVISLSVKAIALSNIESEEQAAHALTNQVNSSVNCAAFSLWNNSVFQHFITNCTDRRGLTYTEGRRVHICKIIVKKTTVNKRKGCDNGTA